MRQARGHCLVPSPRSPRECTGVGYGSEQVKGGALRSTWPPTTKVAALIPGISVHAGDDDDPKEGWLRHPGSLAVTTRGLPQPGELGGHAPT